MEISITDIESGEKIIFPMLPEEIKVEAGNRFASYDVMNVGEIKVPLGEELTMFSWDGILPGESRKNMPYVQQWTDPRGIQEKWSYYRNSNRKLRLLATETPINHDVYLESYSTQYKEGYGDYYYSISFVHAKNLTISTEETKTDQQEAGGGKAEAQSTRPEKEKAGSYTVVSGDSLWKIAQGQLGAGNRYMEIASLNNISNPNKIYPGQVLTLPE